MMVLPYYRHAKSWTRKPVLSMAREMTWNIMLRKKRKEQRT